MNQYLKPYQQRVCDEKTELDDKIQKLVAFFSMETFEALPEYEKALLQMQANAMLVYSGVLDLRINQFYGDKA